jgi:hypothetical protein
LFYCFTTSIGDYKINYNPALSTGFQSNDSEFIAIKNSSDQVVNLSGIYLRQLGLTYQFPFNSSIEAEGTIYLASNSTVFKINME